MKKTTLWIFTICLFAFSWQSQAQYGCDTAVTLTDGFTETGIITDGTQDWNNNPPNSCVYGVYFNDDVYMFQYTSAGFEEIAITFVNRASNNAAGIYATCSGMDFDDCLAGSDLSTTAPTTISAVLSPGQTVYIAVGAYAGALDFDVTDFSVSAITCPAPSNLGVSTTTTTTATLTWDVAASETAWEYVVQAPDTGMPSGAGLAADSNSFVVSDLTAATAYEYYVRANCGADDFSDWVGPYNFATSCDVVTEFFEDFETTEGNTLPICLSQVGTTGVVKTVNNGSVSSNGSRALHIQSTSAADRGMVALQTVSNAGAGTHQFKLNYKATVASQIGQTLEFGYLTDATDASTFVLISSIVTESTTPSEFMSTPSGLPSGDLTFALRTGEENKNLLVDDLSWSLAPTCPYPSNLNVEDITSNSVNLSWEENGTATTWDIEYGESGFTPTETPTVDNTTDNPYMLAGLDAATGYEFYVRSDCGAGDTSDWIGPFAFTTACDVYSLPYLEDFTEFLPACWSEGDNTDVATGPNGANGGWSQDGFLNDGYSGSARFNFYLGGDQDWLVSPTLDLSSGDNGISVNVGVTAFSGTDAETMEANDEVQLVISEDNGATWSVVYTWNEANSPSNTGDNVIIDLSAYNSATAKLAFWANEGNDGTKDYNFYVDDFYLDTYATLSVENVEIQEISGLSYFPNPVSDVFTIKAKKNIDNITVYNLLGQEMLRVSPNSNSSQLDMSQFKVGMYMVQVTMEGVSENIRVIRK